MSIFDHYPGGKNVNGVWQRIINLIPPHTHYYELYLGGGTILRNKRPSAVTVGNDCDRLIIDQWKNYKMDGLTLLNTRALQIIPTVMAINSFVYLDPPYPKDSRRSSTDIYNCELSDQDHQELLSAVHTVDFNCMISTYPNEMYSEALAHWHKVEFQSMTRKGPATEVLYMNYPTPTELHDYRYLGVDCWDRQRIKRKIARKVATLQKLPLLEQRAIMVELNQEQSLQYSKKQL